MDLSITNVRLDLGAGRRGTDMGPSAMHVAGLVGALHRLGHDVVSIRDLGSLGFENVDIGDKSLKFLSQIVEVCEGLAGKVETDHKLGRMPLVLGGDHSVAIGSIGGVARRFRSAGSRLGVIWVDAHLDMNTPETTPSGNIHGMPLAVLLGRGDSRLTEICGPEPALDASDVVIFGARDVDNEEVATASELGVRVYAMSEIDRRGAHECLVEAMETVSLRTEGIHLSFDLDGIDPEVAPGVGTPVPGGLTLRESHLVCEMVCQTRKLVSMDVAELNPTLDLQNKTARLAVWLIESALGKTILR